MMKRFAVFYLVILVTMLTAGCSPKGTIAAGKQASPEKTAYNSRTPDSQKDSAVIDEKTPSNGTVPDADTPVSSNNPANTGEKLPSGNEPLQKAPDAPRGFTVNKIKFTELTLENASQEVQQFIEQNKVNRGYHFFMDKSGEITLVLLSGEKTSGGYGIKVQSVEDNEGRAVVVVDETAPPKDAMVTMQITYPVTIVKFNGTTTNFSITNTKGEAFNPLKPSDINLQPAPEASSERKIAVRGIITKLTASSDKEGFNILVEGKLEADTDYDKAVVRVKPGTLIFKGTTGMSVEELKEGMTIEVEYDGPVMKSYPPQMGADKIIILK